MTRPVLRIALPAVLIALGTLLALVVDLDCVGIAPVPSPAKAADWPMWRYDAGHTAACPHDLPERLHLQWTRRYTQRVPVWDDPLNRDLMGYDRIFEPVVSGGRMFVAFNDADKLVALDCDSGEELWAFYAEAPIRFPPVCFDDNVYFTSDDGHLYCLKAEGGGLKWKFRGGPSARKVLGNRRVISAWPARGGPVVRDGNVYFAASIWPLMGTFIYALDAETGKVVWVNDSTGAQYMLQPHQALSFAGVAPQGTLVATENLLLVPGGRSLPAAFDRRTGAYRFFHLDAGGKGNGGSFVVSDESRFFVHTRYRGTAAYRLADGIPATFFVNEPVLSEKVVYAATSPTQQGKEAVQAFGEDNQVRWAVEADGTGDLIRAGNRLYAAGKDAIIAIDLPGTMTKAKIAWSIPVEATVLRLLAADDKLFAVTLDGRIMAFGPEQVEPVVHGRSLAPAPDYGKPEALDIAEQIIQTAGAAEGYALYYGPDDGALFEAILAQSGLHVVAVETQEARIERIRPMFDARGLYGTRVTIHLGDPVSFRAPPYIAHLVLVGKTMAGRLADQQVLRRVYASVRPYGGGLWLPLDETEDAALLGRLREAGLPQAKFLPVAGGTMILREGPLPGAAEWTHAYGDVANTVKSNDRLVRAPLGVLWFGGNSNADVLPRHGHGPSEQVLGGRLFIEGLNSLSARDVYTGRVLWKRQFEDLGNFDVYYDDSYADMPLSTAYNQVHIPGASQRGTNFVATHEGVYLVEGSRCLLLDVQTGETLKTFEMPAKDGQADPPPWGFLGVYQDVLLGGAGFGDFGRLGYKYQPEKKKGIAFGPDKSASRGLVAFDRHSGEILWKIDAQHTFLHNGIVVGNGRVYLLDKLPKRVEDSNKRRGLDDPATYRLMALDAKTGEELWSESKNVFGSWLGYSEPRDVLLLAGAAAADRSPDEVGAGMAAYRGESGELIWEKTDRQYAGPCMIHNDIIITNLSQHSVSSGAFSLLDGSELMVTDPITGVKQRWLIPRDKGCNTAVASEYLLTFRDGAASYYDLTSVGGTASLGGFKSGCTSNLIAADGVLNAPDYTRTCTCAYQNQTSLALIHMPDVETWTVGQFADEKKEEVRIKQIGVNLGAPGDRRSPEGTLWLEYPIVGGPSPHIPIEVDGSPKWFRHHASRIVGLGLGWVGASGVEGAEKITLRLVPEGTGPAAKYTVRLYFVEPHEEIGPGDRVFDVALQGKPTLTGLDVVREAGGPNRLMVKESAQVLVASELTISFSPKSGRPAVISGIEVIAEPTAGKPAR
ncbi:MAG TPA: PQQ-binding-like beta-propeller repeat protein [Thermoguttaceae bacterium]|nr:PQQ-binding-like beta-propeller repeat protein [Thermoguttaceae bacterium]